MLSCGIQRLFPCSVGLAALLAPAVVHANEFEAMGEGLALLWWLGVYLTTLLVVALFCGIAGMRRFAPKRWKRWAALFCIVDLIWVLGWFAGTFAVPSPGTGFIDWSGLAVTLVMALFSLPSLFLAVRLWKRNRVSLDSQS